MSLRSLVSEWLDVFEPMKANDVQGITIGPDGPFLDHPRGTSTVTVNAVECLNAIDAHPQTLDDDLLGCRAITTGMTAQAAIDRATTDDSIGVDRPRILRRGRCDGPC